MKEVGVKNEGAESIEAEDDLGRLWVSWGFEEDEWIKKQKKPQSILEIKC